MDGTSVSSSGHSLCVEREVVQSKSILGLLGSDEWFNFLVRTLEGAQLEAWGPVGLGKTHV